MSILSPIEQYWLNRRRLPASNFVDCYLVNVWLAM